MKSSAWGSAASGPGKSREARALLSYTEIHAPFAGRVIQKMVDVGDMVTPGQPLFLLDVAAQPQLQAYIAESLIAHLTVGQTLTVAIDALSKTLEGSVAEIPPRQNRVPAPRLSRSRLLRYRTLSAGCTAALRFLMERIGLWSFPRRP